MCGIWYRKNDTYFEWVNLIKFKNIFFSVFKLRGGFNEIRAGETVQSFLSPDTMVLARVGNSFRSSQTLKKTQVQLASRLRWDLFIRYWEWLQDRDYVLALNKNEFTLTPRGNEFFGALLKYYELLHADKPVHTDKPVMMKKA